MPLGTDHLTTTTSAVFIPEVWSAEVLRATERALVMAPKVKRFDALVQNKADTIHIPNLSNLTANDKNANTQVTLQSPTETETTIVIDQHKEASFLVEDLTKVQSQYDLMSEYTEKAGYAIAQAVDSDLLALYASLTTTDQGTYGSDIGDAEILGAIEQLDLVDAPLEDRCLVIEPTQKTAIAKLEKFVKSDWLGEWDMPTVVKVGPVNRYMWGEIYGVPVYYTNQVPQTAGTPVQIHNILFHKEAFALAMQQSPRTQADYIIEYLGNLVVCDVIYGVKVLRSNFGVEVRS